jgi:hypothetical protein
LQGGIAFAFAEDGQIDARVRPATEHRNSHGEGQLAALYERRAALERIKRCFREEA